MATEGSDQTTPRAGDGAAPARSDGAVLRLWLARHAESVGNVERRLQGSTDSPLSDFGLRQAEALARRLAKEPLAAIWTSPLQRARRTAEAVAAAAARHRGRPLPLRVDARLAERHFGSLEDSPYGHDRAVPLGGEPPESMRAVHQRALDLLNHLLDAHLLQPGAAASGAPTNILLVSHGLFLQTLVRTALVLGTPGAAPTDAPRFDVFHANAALSVLELRVSAAAGGGDAAARVIVRRAIENERAHLAALVRPPRALAKAAVASGQTKLTALWGAKRARTEATGDDATGPND